jgi:hypothetical protein
MKKLSLLAMFLGLGLFVGCETKPSDVAEENEDAAAAQGEANQAAHEAAAGNETAEHAAEKQGDANEEKKEAAEANAEAAEDGNAPATPAAPQ